jgi:hypothetical protein
VLPASAGGGAAVAVGVDRWSRGGTPFGTSEEHYQMELPQPSSFWFPVGVDCIVLDHDVADELWKCPSIVERHALL